MKKIVCYVSIGIQTHICIRHICVHMPRLPLGECSATRQPWLPLGRGVGITFHCIPFVPFEFCTMYM